MDQKWFEPKNGWKEALLAALAAVLIQLLAMLVIFPAFQAYFVKDPSLWDCGHFARFIVKGYQEPETRAFYPAWPLLVRVLFFQTFEPAANHVLADCFKPMAYLSLFLNLLFLILAAKYFRKLLQPALAGITVFILLALNPLGVFRILGYSESLFCLLSVCLLFLLEKKDLRFPHYAGIFVLSALMSLTRPVLVIFGAAAVAAFLISLAETRIAGGGSPDQKTGKIFRSVLALLSGLVAGYAVLGLSHVFASRSFWEPFAVQALWDKKVSLMNFFNNIIHPASWGGKAVLTWDILAVLAPVGLLIWSLVKMTSRKKSFGPTYWFSLLTAVFTVGLVMLTQKDLHSLSRYVFATPFFFVPLGYWLAGLKGKTGMIAGMVLAAISLSCMIYWWVLYVTPGAWMG